MLLTVISLNAKGLNHPAKRHSLWQTAEKLGGDIICVQETHLTQMSANLCYNNKYAHIYRTNYTSKKRGVLIVIKRDTDFQPLQELYDPNGRFLILICTVNGVKYTILNLYAPNSRQTNFIRKTISKAISTRQGHLLVCSDFNLVADVQMDTTSAAKRRNSPLGKLLTSFDLHDAWRCHHGSEKDYTYFSPHHKSYSRIDMFLADKWLLQNVSTSTIHPMTWSDHNPISVWINDISILQHPTYSSEIADHLKEYFELNDESVADPTMVWNAHKAVIRGIIIKLSSICKKKRTQQIDSLTSQIAKLETEHKTNPNPNLLEQLLTLRQELRSLLLYSYEYMQRKIKATSYSTSNKAGKKLAQHIKGAKIKSKIPYIFHPHSKEKLSNPQDITNAFSDYYSDLYNLNIDASTHQPSPDEIDEFLSQITLPTLTETTDLFKCTIFCNGNSRNYCFTPPWEDPRPGRPYRRVF